LIEAHKGHWVEHNIYTTYSSILVVPQKDFVTATATENVRHRTEPNRTEPIKQASNPTNLSVQSVSYSTILYSIKQLIIRGVAGKHQQIRETNLLVSNKQINNGEYPEQQQTVSILARGLLVIIGKQNSNDINENEHDIDDDSLCFVVRAVLGVHHHQCAGVVDVSIRYRLCRESNDN